MRITDRGTVVRGKKGSPASSCAFPGVAVLPSGRWICGFRAAPTKAAVGGQQALVTWSDDRGKNWREPFVPLSPPVLDGKRGVFRSFYPTALGSREVLASILWVDASDPSLPFFNVKNEGLLESRIFHSLSADDGETW